MRLRRFLITEPIWTTFTSVVTYKSTHLLWVEKLRYRSTSKVTQLLQKIPVGKCELLVLEF
jgi:hypothetical protein